MNLTDKPPLGLKEEKQPPDPDYISRMHDLPCVICEVFGMAQMSPTTAHHTICDRNGTRRTHDHLAIPLCDGHHQGDRDKSKYAIHRGKETWVEAYGPDTDYIEMTKGKLGL